jgi:hypothetical protein
MKNNQVSPYNDIRDTINQLAKEINDDLNSKRGSKYLEDVLLLYSFIENLLKWILFVKLIWDKSFKYLKGEEIRLLRQSCKSLSFFQSIIWAYSINILTQDLQESLMKIKDERNAIVHQLWLYTHRNNKLVLRKKLEKVAGISNELVELFNKLADKIGLEIVYDLIL